MIVAITIVLIVIIICATILIYEFVENSDAYSLYNTDKKLSRITEIQEEILEILRKGEEK